MNSRWLLWISGSVLAIATFAGGLILLLTAFNVDWCMELLIKATDPRQKATVIVLGALLVAAAGLFVLSIGRPESAVGKISFENPHGTVTISAAAIREFIARRLEGHPRIRALKSGLVARDDGVEVVLDVSVEPEGDLPGLLATLQDDVQRRIQDELGVEAIRSVRVHVSEIVPARSSKAGADPAAETT